MQCTDMDINTYQCIDMEQRQFSNIISMAPQSAASSSFPGLPMWSPPAMTSTCEQVKTGGHTTFTTVKSHLT